MKNFALVSVLLVCLLVVSAANDKFDGEFEPPIEPPIAAEIEADPADVMKATGSFKALPYAPIAENSRYASACEFFSLLLDR